MVNAHCADAMVCISNCDKITPGMLMAAMRLNIPVGVRLGRADGGGQGRAASGKEVALDLVDAMVARPTTAYTDEEVEAIERSACPTCGSCSGMFTANSMNCLTEALGLSLPGNGSTLATHADRKRLFLRGGPHSSSTCPALLRAGRRKRAAAQHRQLQARSKTPWRSTSRWADRPTPCCICWPPRMRRSVDFTMADIDRLSRKRAVPVQGRAGQERTSIWRTSTAPAGSWRSWASWTAAGLLHTRAADGAQPRPWAMRSTSGTSAAPTIRRCSKFFKAAPGGVPTQTAFSQSRRWEELDLDRENGVIRIAEHAFSKDGGLAVL